MKKSIILKSFLVILVCAMFAFTMMSSVYAATDDGFDDILGDGTSNNSSNTGNTNTNTNSANTNSANTNTNTNSANTNTNTNGVQNLNSVRNSVNNASNSLPNTGIGDSLPTVVLVVVFAISAVYAYKKVKDYRSID